MIQFYPDWLFVLEKVAKSILYVGVGFALFTHFCLKWMERLWGKVS